MEFPAEEVRRVITGMDNDFEILNAVITFDLSDYNSIQQAGNYYFYYKNSDWLNDFYKNENWVHSYYTSTTQLTSTKQTFLSFKEANNFKILNKSFEMAENDSSFSKDKVISNFTKVAVLLSQLPFEKSAVEITSLDSIKFSMTFTDGIILIISKPFDRLEDVSDNEIIFSIFKNREMIASNVANTKDFLGGFKRFLFS